MTSHTENTSLRGGNSECVGMREQGISQPRPAMTRGIVEAWHGAYGFIRPLVACGCPCHQQHHKSCVHCIANHRGDIFVHQKSIVGMDGYRQLIKGQQVEFELGHNDKGRCALHCRVVNQ